VVEQVEREVRKTVDRGLDHVGLPSTRRLEELARDAAGEIGRRIPLPDAGALGDELRRRTDWLDRQLEPIGDRFEPVRDRIDDELRRHRDRPETDNEEDDDGWGVIEWVLFLLALDALSESELSVEFDVDRALWSFDQDADGTFEVWNRSVFTPAASLAARLGDPMMHGDPVAPGAGSPNVFIGAKPALRICDTHVCTKITITPHVGAGFVSTYGGVEINGFAALRIGDYLNEGPHGNNPIVGGCPSVHVGPVAPPVPCMAPGGESRVRRPDLFPFRWRKGEVGHFKGKVVLGVDIDGPLVRVEGTVTAARLWAEETTVVDVPLGDFDRDGKAEALRLATTTKTERLLGVSEVKFEAHPVARRVDEAKATPKNPEPKLPEITATSEIVELPS